MVKGILAAVFHNGITAVKKRQGKRGLSPESAANTVAPAAGQNLHLPPSPHAHTALLTVCVRISPTNLWGQDRKNKRKKKRLGAPEVGHRESF